MFLVFFKMLFIKLVEIVIMMTVLTYYTKELLLVYIEMEHLFTLKQVLFIEELIHLILFYTNWAF